MRNLIILLLLSFVTACSGPEKAENIVESHPYLVGKWSGEGGFLDTDLKNEIGDVWVEFEIFNDNSVTGKIGDAQIIDAELSIANYGIGITGMLDSKIKDGHELDKDHIIILLVLPEDYQGDINTSDAKFHLKSNSIFDFGMRVGGVMLVRE